MRVGAIGDPDRPDRRSGVDRRLEHGGPEGAAAPSAPGAALGEHHDPGAGAQDRRDLPYGGGQGAQPVAVDEQGAAARGERPQEWPAPDLALGDRPAGQHGRDQRYVEPGDVVGDDQFAAVRGAVPGTGRQVRPDDDAYAERLWNGARPAPGQPVSWAGPEQPDQWDAGHPQQDQGAAGHQKEGGGQQSAYGAGVPGAAVRGARGDGQPAGHRSGAGDTGHRSGARERKWRR